MSTRRTGTDSESKVDLVYSKLKEEVLTRRLAPGDNLTLADIANRFRVSKTPVREAFNRLVSDGFIQVLPRRGYLVVPISVQDFINLFQVRVLLELGALEVVAQQVMESDLKRLSQLTEFSETGPDSAARFMEQNARFHLAIAAATQNRLLYSILEGVLEKLRRVLFLDLQLSKIEPEVADHQAIVEAIRRHDVQEAKALMSRHMERLRNRIFNIVLPITNYAARDSVSIPGKGSEEHG